MKKAADIVCAIAASLISLLGWGVSVGAVASLTSFNQLQRLLTFDYLSFADSRAIGGTGNDFFTGVALSLIGSVLFTRVDRMTRIGKTVAGLLLLFVAFTLAFTSLNPRIGVQTP
ncbi:hypothetical protein [Trinickia sp.]|uniref:hypothetical protein n=1 Tax=Trinickia sp. TaxID=2571163 RepID=UPI003F7FEF51